MKKYKIAHIAEDSIFAESAYYLFTHIEGIDNIFIRTSKRSKHLGDKAIEILYNDLLSEDTQKILNQTDLIVIHFLYEKIFELLPLLDKHVKVLWSGWGGDYYWMIDTLPDFNLYQPKTQKLVGNRLKSTLIYKKVKHLKLRKKVNIINKYIDYIALPVNEDYDRIKRNYPNFKPKLIDFTYGIFERSLTGTYIKLDTNSHNILIGNSATPTNNHLDIFDILTKIKPDESEIFLPLSYGDKNYGNIIAQKAKDLFKQDAVIIDNYLPYDEYTLKISSCTNVIMGQMRQQGLGNVNMMLYLGAKLFFYEKSVNYQFYKNRGFEVYTIESLIDNPSVLLDSLDSNVQSKNSQLVIDLFGWEAALNRVKRIVEE